MQESEFGVYSSWVEGLPKVQVLPEGDVLRLATPGLSLFCRSLWVSNLVLEFGDSGLVSGILGVAGLGGSA